MSEKVIAVVPARLGSQRVKCKNLRLLNGKPLIEYILDTLKQTKYLTDIYINSESDYFGEIAKRNGVKFYKRKAELATSTSMIDEYIYDFIITEKPDYLAVVNPTSPFATADDLDKGWEYFKNNDCDTMLSGENIRTHCFYKQKAINYSTDGLHPRSQDLEPVFALNFMITIWDCKKYKEHYEKNGNGVYTGKLGFYPTQGNANIDVDFEDDFIFAEFIARFLDSEQEVKVEYSDVIQELIDNKIKTEN